MEKWLPCPSDYPENRLFSLDLLRGLDMFLLTVIGPLVAAAQSCWSCFPPAVMRQFSHGWECFTLWDIIMPLFIFMCGAAIPLALGRRMKEGLWPYWRHVLGRVALLWFLGGLVQGRWASLDPNAISPFSNTLQSIAIGYLAVAAVAPIRSRTVRIAVPVVFAAVYTVALAVGGDYTQFGNLAYKVDHRILSAILPVKNAFVVRPSSYTWFLTSLMFAVMTFAGYFAMRILIAEGGKRAKALRLIAYGVALLAVGLVAGIWIPVIKPIFTLSFTAQAMGWCVIALAALYVVNDILMIRRGTSLILLFGQFALTAYFVSHFFRAPLKSLAETVGGGVAARLGSGGPFLIAAFGIVGMILTMIAWRRLRRRR